MRAVNPPRTGRPPTGEARTGSMTVPLRPDEKALIRQAAEKADRTPTDYGRRAMLEQARRDLADPGHDETPPPGQ